MTRREVRVRRCDYEGCDLPAAYKFSDGDTMKYQCVTHAWHHVNVAAVMGDTWPRRTLRQLTDDELLIYTDDDPGPAPAA